MSPFRLGLFAAAGIAFFASLGLWHFGSGFPRVLEVLFMGPGKPMPPILSHPLYASAFAILYVTSLALACGAVLATSRQRALNLRGRVALVLAGLVMAVGGVGIAWAMQNAVSMLSIAARSETRIKANAMQIAVSENVPRMQFGLTALCLPPLGLFLCGLIGFGSASTGSDRPPLPWLYLLSVAVIGLYLVVVFAAAIPSAIRLPEFFAANRAFKVSDIVAVIQRLISIGRAAAYCL